MIHGGKIHFHTSRQNFELDHEHCGRKQMGWFVLFLYKSETFIGEVFLLWLCYYCLLRVNKEFHVCLDMCVRKTVLLWRDITVWYCSVFECEKENIRIDSLKYCTPSYINMQTNWVNMKNVAINQDALTDSWWSYKLIKNIYFSKKCTDGNFTSSVFHAKTTLIYSLIPDVGASCLHCKTILHVLFTSLVFPSYFTAWFSGCMKTQLWAD